jgi:hypothetical protein
MRAYLLIVAMLVVVFPAYRATTDPAQAQGNLVRFAVIGDFGSGDVNERDVANLVQSWSPEFIITVGDNNYPSGAASTIDANIGQFYHAFISPYGGSYGAGADINRFFPSLGNHDWAAPGARPYLDYFTLPGNERYYDFVWGPVHLFAIDSDSHEPDGNTSTSIQAAWLREKLADSLKDWKLVYFHHPPYSSGNHGSSTELRWPFQEWGATAVLTGHDHDYERLIVNGFAYFVNGLGGRPEYQFRAPLPESQLRYNSDFGAMLIEASHDSIRFQFISRASELIDTYTIHADNLPRIFSASISGKRVIVQGKNFDLGAGLLMNGDKQRKIRNDAEHPTTILVARKLGKKLAPGETVSLQVRNLNGALSESFEFRRP